MADGLRDAALAATQREMLAGAIAPLGGDGGERPSALDHPRYWAPFVLIGSKSSGVARVSDRSR